MEAFLKLIPIACIFHTASLQNIPKGHWQDYPLENITWFQTRLSDYPVRDLEYDFHVEFPINVCCPIIVIVGDYINPDIWAKECYENVRLDSNWLKHIFFKLATWEENSYLQCNRNSTSGMITCDVSGVVQRYHQPFHRLVTIGYMCNEVKDKGQS